MRKFLSRYVGRTESNDKPLPPQQKKKSCPTPRSRLINTLAVPQLSEVDKGTKQRAMMYDDASQNTSTAYFKLFQVLRTLEGMVKETLADFRNWHFKVVKTLEGPSLEFEQAHLEATLREWRDLGGRLEARLGGIRQRIAEERADVQSLSDNVRNFLFPFIYCDEFLLRSKSCSWVCDDIC
jgi:hypothetical protein